MTEIVKTEMYSSFQKAAKDIAEHIKNGWDLDTRNPPDVHGFNMVVTYVAHETTPKRSRAEILAAARAAKASKKKGEN